MAIQYTIVPEVDFSRGIDARSTENQIGEGFVRDLLNADVIQKSVRKRTGYESYAGNIPVRATRLDYDYNVDPTKRMMCLTLDSVVSLNTTVSLESVRSSPLIVYGRSSNQTTGPITNAGDSAHYYNRFTIPIRKELFAPSGTLNISGTEHGLGSTNFFCNVVESTSLTDKSFTDVYTNALRIDKMTYDVNIDYTVFQNKNAIVYYLDRAVSAGDVYTTTWAHPGGISSLPIPTSTHNLTNYNFVYKIYQDTNPGNSTGEWLEVVEDEFTIDNNGNVLITMTAASPTTYHIILSAAATTNVVEGQISSAEDEKTVSIPNLVRPWMFYNIYIRKNATEYERVEANAIDYDNDTNSLILTFDTYSAQSYKIHYEYGDIRSNVLCVYDTAVAVDSTDTSPQITIWGLDHNEIYTDKSVREGWATHIDTYRRSGEQRVICGLGGNLFAAREYSEAGSQYLYPTLYPSLYSRTSAALSVGPVFYDTGDNPQRTRGYITTSIGGTGQVYVTAVQYDPANTWTKYTLDVPDMNIVGTLSTIISNTAGLEDWLTVSNMSYKRHEGTFRIRQVTPGVEKLEIWVENSNNSSDWDDLAVGGYAGIYTDRITWTTDASYVPQDTLLLSGSELGQVYSSDDGITVCGPFNQKLELAIGVLVTGRRTSSVIPLRESLPSLADSVANLVRGDMLSYTGIDRSLRVLSINAGTDLSASISGDGTTATCTVSDTTYLSAGQKIVIIGASDYSGVQTITNVISSTQFTFESTSTKLGVTAILSGKTIEIDEELTWQDTVGDQAGFQVARRWVPVEAPDDSYNLTPSTYVRYFDSAQYSAQPFIRSTMVADNLYLTNGSDEVMKFDGESIYRAGLPAWQPGLFVTRDTSVGIPKIVVNLRSMAYKAKPGSGTLELTKVEEAGLLPPGSTVEITGDTTKIYTVQDYVDKANQAFVHFSQSLNPAIPNIGTISEVGYYRYYIRLNAIDANNNRIASAMTSSEDLTVRMSQDAAINLKMVGLPALDNYDYDRIEIEIYRTRLLTGTVPPVFYKVTTLGSEHINFNNGDGYIEYTDTASDDNIALRNNLDPLVTQAGAELGIGWSDPLRAKYITTTANRLVLANVSDYPEFDIQIDGASTALDASKFVGNTFLFRKNFADSASSSNMVDRVNFKWVQASSSIAVTNLVGVANTSFTVTVNNTAAIGDWVYLYYSQVLNTGQPLKYSGWWQVFSRTSTTITFTYKNASAGTPAVYPNRAAFADSGIVPVVLGTDGNLGQDNGDSGSPVTNDTFDATRRLALALNSVMRMTDITIPAMAKFRPWLIARSGNDVSRAGRILVRAPQQSDILPSIQATFTAYDLYVNSLPVETGDNTPASERVYPSRVLISYENNPELFDSPTVILDSDSLSAIDINPADGQEITGVIPFFGETAFTAAQQAGILVVFKTNSIYLVDINQKVSGSNLVVQRLETQGLGCTAPYSISVTKNGIMFANNSGIYCLRRNQAIEYIGKFMERNWTSKVDRDALQIAQGHHYSVGRMYKLSVPIADTQNETTGYIEPSQVYVYNHTQEDEEQHLGAWSRYDNHTAIGWANLASDAFWASTGGSIYKLRSTGSGTDFRDSNEAITFRLDTRPNDYGNSGIRKILDKVVASYRAGTKTASNTMLFAVDLEQEYFATTPFRVAGTAENLNGLDDLVQKDVVTLRHSLDRRKGVYFSIRIENSNLDQNVEVAGLDYRVGALDTKGIKSASKT